MNEKNYRIIIIILSIVTAISIGIGIYFGTANPSRTGEKLTLTVEQQRNTIENQRATIEQLQNDLSGVRESIVEATGRADDLERQLGRIAEFASESAVRIDRASIGTGTAVERQQRINQLVGELIADNKRLKELTRSEP
jgi:predicted  nucleic acid-binding Zn-ribbon protein